ncbi:hypothetical protein [Mesorhizobium sp. M0296]|uniref:hypothetical protein n=1 Tax=Mesorhizobium sp. M0296 TaxID=2956931 RepID=UPI00333C7BEE
MLDMYRAMIQSPCGNGEAPTMTTQINENEVRMYWGAMADLRAAEQAGDIAEQEYLHCELDALATHSDNPTIRALAGKAVNHELAENVYRRGPSD